MTTPDLLTTVGFEKGKIGSGEKEVGYQIKESSLSSLVGSLLICFLVMGLMVVCMVYDVRLEKKTFHRERRVEEHHAASKLAQVQMELWSQYRDDVQESREATRLMATLNASYTQFKPKLEVAVNDVAKDMGLNTDRASKFADKILHVVADMQKDNMAHAKKLLEHLVKAGKKGEKLERHIEKEMLAEIREEEKHVEEDVAEGIADEVEGGDVASLKGASANITEQDPLKVVLRGFWETFDDYEREFSGSVRDNFRKGHSVYEELQTLWGKIQGPNPPSEEEVGAALEKIDLASVGAPLGEGRILPVNDIVEELVMVPRIPYKELAQLEMEWKTGKSDSVTVLSKLQQMHTAGKVPSGWLNQGAVRQEDYDEMEHDTGGRPP
mmetsp:Transcript_52647/g.137147  ORF Transcript_52647/g.137147 Transcript_52647/m.137147 type:complete len:382 (-) Transcript_52647:112-1257(-)